MRERESDHWRCSRKYGTLQDHLFLSSLDYNLGESNNRNPLLLLGPSLGLGSHLHPESVSFQHSCEMKNERTRLRADPALNQAICPSLKEWAKGISCEAGKDELTLVRRRNGHLPS